MQVVMQPAILDLYRSRGSGVDLLQIAHMALLHTSPCALLLSLQYNSHERGMQVLHVVTGAE